MRYRFGEYELDTEAYALTRDGHPLHLRPKVFDLIRFLIERRGRIVTKQELLDGLWGLPHVNEAVVAWSINHARRALGQGAHERQPIIETLYSRGYRFAAAVEVMADGPLPSARSGDARSVGASLEALPFVGRAELMEGLRQRLTRAQAGRGALCLLVGEPGIGKTRCMDELAFSARSLAFSTWSGRATEDRWAPALWPWTQVLRCAADERGVGDRAAPLLAQLSALSSSRITRDPSLEGAPQPGRFVLLDSVARFLLQASRRAPLLVLLDDLHWADGATVDLLTAIAPELRRHPLLIVASQRDWLDEYRARRLPQLTRYAERIELPPLTTGDVGQYIGLVSSGHSPDAALSAAVHRATAGNALFLQETVRSLVAQHGVSGLSSLSPADVKPPQLARHVLRERLGLLDPDTRAVLGSASVLGEVFETDLLREVSGVPFEGLIGALDVAVRAGLLTVDGAHGHRFCHALVRNVLYDDLPSTERIGAHRSAALAIERAAHLVPRHAELAHHYYRSLALGHASAVAGAARRAAEEAVDTGEYEDASVFCQWALEAQALDVETSARERAELLLLRARSARHAGSGHEARAAVAQLVDLASQYGFADLLVRAARVLRPGRTWSAFIDAVARKALEEALRVTLDESDESRISALAQLASVAPYAHDMERSKTLSAEALALARRQGKPIVLAEALRARLYALSGPDDIDAVQQVAREMLALDGDAGSWISIAAHSACYGAAIHRGDLAAGEQALDALGRTAQTQRRPEALWYHERLSMQRRFLEGDLGGAQDAFAELERVRFNFRAWLMQIPLALEAIDRLGVPAAAASWDLQELVMRTSDLPAEGANLARIAARFGRSDIARPMLTRFAERDFGSIPKGISYLNTLANLSLVAIALDDRPRAECLYGLLAPYPRHNTPTALLYYEGSVSHYLALLAELLGRRERAVAHFEDALALNESLGHKAQLARTYYEFARFLLGGGAGASASKRAQQLKSQGTRLAAALGLGALEAQARAL